MHLIPTGKFGVFVIQYDRLFHNTMVIELENHEISKPDEDKHSAS